jgi:hypothetical protein
MKTPVEKLFELLWDTPKDKLTWYAIRNQMVKEEMAEIIEAFHTGMEMQRIDPNNGIAEEYYSLRFNTKEKVEDSHIWTGSEWWKGNGTVAVPNDNLVPFHTVCGCEVCGCTMGSTLVIKRGTTTTITSTGNPFNTKEK